MTRALLAFGAVCGAMAALMASALDTGPLPERTNQNCTRDLWPEKDLAAVTIGAYEYQVYRIFGRREGWPPIPDPLEPQRCLAFRYDASVLDEPIYLNRPI